MIKGNLFFLNKLLEKFFNVLYILYIAQYRQGCNDNNYKITFKYVF